MNATPAPPDNDAAMVLGMASTAIPFARSPAAEAERWLRILRLHGEAGTALQALGVSEAPLEAPPPGRRAAGTAGCRGQCDTVAERRREPPPCRPSGVPTVGARATCCVAVMDVYGGDFDRVLRVHGTDRDEVLDAPRAVIA